jgi:type I restriction enzyme S subunit
MTTDIYNDVYTVPEGWRRYTADEIKSPDRYSCVAGPFGSNISSKYFVDEGVPVIRGSNLRDDLTRFVSENLAFVSQQQALNYKPQHVRPGDLVFTCWGTIGQVGIIPEDGPYDEYIISNKQLKLSLDKRIADPLFCFYYFSSPSYVDYIRSRNIGGAVPGINLGILKSLTIALPSLEEQRRIVGILSAYDDLMANNNQRIELLQKAARCLFDEWFVHLRYPGHSGNRVIGGVPSGWQRAPLGSFVDLNVDSFSSKELPAEITYVDISSVKEGRIVAKSKFGASEAPGRARRRAKHGDVIWSNVRPNLRQFALVLNPQDTDIFSTGFTIISPKRIPFSFLYCTVTTDAFVSYLVNQTTGASYPAVRPNDFERGLILVPDGVLMDTFHQQCEPNLLMADNLLRQNRKLAAARDLFLPRLMDGRIEA